MAWYTTGDNPDKPKAGIWTYVDQNGSRMYLGTSNSYASGITNAAIDIESDGRVGIGMAPGGAYKLDVAGGIRGCFAKVEVLTGCDFVFENSYSLPSFEKRISGILKNKHLPYIKPAIEMEKEGMDIGETVLGVLRNVEEHDLYLYEQNKKMEELQKQIDELKRELDGLKNKK